MAADLVFSLVGSLEAMAIHRLARLTVELEAAVMGHLAQPNSGPVERFCRDRCLSWKYPLFTCREPLVKGL